MNALEQAQTEASQALVSAAKIFYDCAAELKRWEHQPRTPDNVINDYEESHDLMNSARQRHKDAHAAWTAESCRQAGI